MYLGEVDYDLKYSGLQRKSWSVKRKIRAHTKYSQQEIEAFSKVVKGTAPENR